MTRLLPRISVALALAAAPFAAPAQQNQGGGAKAQHQHTSQHKPQKAQVGAGTDDDTTTGSSGPQGGGGGKPPLPQAKLCNSYKGAVQQDCLDTVLRKQAQQSGAQQPRNAAPPATPSTPPNSSNGG